MNRYRTILIITGILGVLALVTWIVYYSFFTLHISSTTPNTSSISYLSPQLMLHFNKDIDPESVQIESDDLTITSTTTGSSVTINIFTAMSADTPYTITLRSIRSTDGYQMENHDITFTPSRSESSVTDRDRDIILERQEKNKPAVINDPIFAYIPHSTLSYSIEAFVDNAGTEYATVTLEVTIPLTAADVRIDKEGAIAQAKQAALAYLNSLEGIDLQKYQIIYSVIDPSL